MIYFRNRLNIIMRHIIVPYSEEVHSESVEKIEMHMLLRIFSNSGLEVNGTLCFCFRSQFLKLYAHTSFYFFRSKHVPCLSVIVTSFTSLGQVSIVSTQADQLYRFKRVRKHIGPHLHSLGNQTDFHFSHGALLVLNRNGYC